MEWLSPIEQIVKFVLPFLERLPILRVLLGFILVFLLPGFAWSLVFFKKIKLLERIALSFGLSIVVVILSIFVLNVLFRVSITALNSLLIITVITIVPIFFYYLRKLAKRGNNQESV